MHLLDSGSYLFLERLMRSSGIRQPLCLIILAVVAFG